MMACKVKSQPEVMKKPSLKAKSTKEPKPKAAKKK